MKNRPITEFLNRRFPNEKYPPLFIHIIYLLAAFTFCYLYHLKIVAHADFYNHDYAAILKVINIEAIRSIQYRVLVPLIFKVISLFGLLPDKGIFFLIMLGFTYLTITVFYRLLCVYFENKVFNSFAALSIIYPMIWNFFAINTIFFFVDTAVVFFMTLCLYLVVTGNNRLLLAAFFLGTANHYSIGFIIPVYLLYNYRCLFKKETILYTAALVFILIGYFAVMRILLPDLSSLKDDGFVVWDLSKAVQAFKDYYKPHMVRDIIFTWGGLHFFALMCLLSGAWKTYKRGYIAVYLTVFPFILFALLRFGIRIEEMRNYIPFIPFVIIPALIYISKFTGGLLKPNKEICLPEEEPV